MNHSVRLACLLGLLAPGLAHSEQQPKVDLPSVVKPDPEFNKIRTFRCDFQSGEGRDSFKEPNAKIKDGSLGELIFDSLNYQDRSARLIGNIGSSDVTLLDGELAVSLLESTDVGGLTVTTIFKGASVGLPLARTYRAVSSRHIARTFGGETTTQHYGTRKGLL